ncbi:CBFD_NFYB_HMF domain-containing protein [Cephalotus follicularis]|uniref:CBFD_NFYB_HMF domain-containing protein n=1 Tax=Cephalotus follicularis TaxID=3775 RepID=A0A1Q3BEF9_CEPFO|nr:CBFD_NFYB_HMF domain-containing protein [Cephalotus follicularis]
MASSEKTEGKEHKKEKNRQQTKTKTTKTTSTTTTSKTKTNGSVKNGVHEEVIVVPSSSCDSQESQQQQQHTKNCNKKTGKKPNRGKRKEKEASNGNKNGEEEEEAKMCVFPMMRVKRIMKSDASDSHISQDAVFLVNQASVMFIQQFCEDAYECCMEDRKKSLHYNHLSSVVSKQRRYDFLSDFVPQKLKAKDALAEWKAVHGGG